MIPIATSSGNYERARSSDALGGALFRSEHIPWTAVARRDTSEPAQVDLYEHLLHMSVLLLLDENPADSWALRAGLSPLGFEHTEAELQRTLGGMAAAGLVQPICEPAERGAYGLTADGGLQLAQAATDLRATEVVLGGFLARCAERFVAP